MRDSINTAPSGNAGDDAPDSMMGMRGFPEGSDLPLPDFLAALELSPVAVAEKCRAHLSEAEQLEVATSPDFEEAVSCVRMALLRSGLVPEDHYPNIFG